MTEKIAFYIKSYYIVAIAICDAELFLSGAMLRISVYNVAAIVSMLFNIITSLRIMGWRFGKTGFMSDSLYDKMKSKGKSEEDYRNVCINRAAKLFIPASGSFVLAAIASVVFYFVL